MARAVYPLNNAREATLVSSNETTYTINILWTGAGNTTANSMTLGKAGVQISYENPNDKDKNSYIITSTCTISYLVTSDADKNFIASLSTTYEERDVWITVREGFNMLWAGYMILDLKDEQDVSYPYEVSLKAIDGLAALKSLPFIRETNIDTGAIPSYPYVSGDTFITAGFQNIIGGSGGIKWLSRLVNESGMVLASDSAGASSNFLTNFKIQTAVNYYNEGHPAPADDIDPLAYTQIKMKDLNSIVADNYIDPPNCHTALQYICKNFGMRCVYWQHAFHFVAIDEYNTDEDAAGTPAGPINIPTRVYLHTGVAHANQDYLGTNSLSIYNLTIENQTAPGEGLQKLAGTVYSGSPALKKIKGIYLGSGVGFNAYRGMPLLPSTWDTTGNEITYNTYTLDGSGAAAWSTMSGVADADGIRFNCWLSFRNTANNGGPSFYLKFRTVFILVAKPSTQLAAVGPDTKVCARSTSATEYTWEDWTSGTQPFTGTDTLLKYASSGTEIPTINDGFINQNQGIKVYDTNNDVYCTTTHNGLFPTNAAFTGDWDFIPLTITCYDSNATLPLRGFDGTQSGGSPTDYGSVKNHGQVYAWSGTGTTYNGTLLAGPWSSAPNNMMSDIDFYQYEYDNMLANSAGAILYEGKLIAVGNENFTDAFIEIKMESDSTNSLDLDNGTYYWGEQNTTKVSNGGGYVFTGNEKWTKPSYVWNNLTTKFDYTVGSYNKKLVALLFRDILYNQGISLRQFNGTTALAVKNKTYTGTSILKYMNPIGKLTDADGKEYMLSSGVFNILMDEWEVTLNEMVYSGGATLTTGENTYLGEIVPALPDNPWTI